MSLLLKYCISFPALCMKEIAECKYSYVLKGDTISVSFTELQYEMQSHHVFLAATSPLKRKR